ncbi:MAG TPA: hydrogenase formation protein HypD, partial [Fimbriimonadaceae bacterium]|nr:hydrogenase formation protein HypD [Fimbriimonadaceae bacterium]
IRAATTRPWTIMEICGGQTHSIVRFGIDELLPPQIQLVHGPGCPVCVTPVRLIDQAIHIAKTPGCILCSFGDMLRVPGSETDLLQAKALGADVRSVYSPLDAVKIAEAEPDRKVVFFAVGFETTAPANALSVKTAAQKGLKNFSALVAHVLVPPAIEAILGAADNRVQGFLAAGHVCAVMGVREYEPLAAKYRTPIVVTGFEPADLLQGVLMCVRQLEEGRFEVENPYARMVQPDGNQPAKALIEEVFEIADREWRGIGTIPSSGLALRERYREFDASLLFPAPVLANEREKQCRAAEVLQGKLAPSACPAFGVLCTPESPLGAPMVSTEGACAAYFRYRSRESALTPVEGASAGLPAAPSIPEGGAA